MGAAGMLGGVTRITMSLAVILVELTDDINLMLPILLTVLVAKQVAPLPLPKSSSPSLQPRHAPSWPNLGCLFRARPLPCPSADLRTLGDVVTCF